MQPPALAQSFDTAGRASMFNFLGLPRELRDQIYWHAMVQDNYICVRDSVHGDFKSWEELEKLLRKDPDPWYSLTEYSLSGQLLRANKQIYDEAINVLYASNCFEFGRRQDLNLTCFIQRIGTENARRIRHICMEFPTVKYTPSTEVAPIEQEQPSLMDYDISFLKILKRCPSLRSVTMDAGDTYLVWDTLNRFDNKVLSRALNAIDRLIQDTSSLEKSATVTVIIDSHGLNFSREYDVPNERVQRSMKRRGWKLKMRQVGGIM